MENFEGKYLDNEYNIVCDPKSPQTFYMYNPETIIKVGLITDQERAESLYIQWRYDEAIKFCAKNLLMQLKVEAAQINHLFINRKYEKIGRILEQSQE